MLTALLPHNQSTLERVVRIVLGLALLSLVFVGPQSWFGLIGLIPVVTGAVGSCPIYTALGFSTCPVPKR